MKKEAYRKGVTLVYTLGYLRGALRVIGLLLEMLEEQRASFLARLNALEHRQDGGGGDVREA